MDEHPGTDHPAWASGRLAELAADLDTALTLLATVRAVLTEVDTVWAERDRYRAALVAMVGEDAPTVTTAAGRYCVYCYAGNIAYAGIQHTATCAWLLAQAALDGGPAAGDGTVGIG